MPKYPFEVSVDELRSNLDEFVSIVFSSLESEFLILPKGEGFIDYAVFEEGYEQLKRATAAFTRVTPKAILPIVIPSPIVLIVLRSMLGFTPPEWAYMAARKTGVEIPQGAVRSLDRRIRKNPLRPLGKGRQTTERVQALLVTACALLREGAPSVPPGKIHRLDKADTRRGLETVRTIADLGAPYPMLLYERFLGRPFAGHRDSVSELVGAQLEVQIEQMLTAAGISNEKTKRAQKIPGLDQAPDFTVPDRFHPQVLIEAKITEDDGTARDKVTRIQHLAHLSQTGRRKRASFEVIACIGGRGFGIRREDMRKLLLATNGKTFTLKNLSRLIECTRLHEFQTRPAIPSPADQAPGDA